jgi:tetratricopeptide (TPR) repeat protein
MFGPLIGIVAAVVLTIPITYGGLAFIRSLAGVFHQTERGWQRLPNLPEAPLEVRVSGQGTAWVMDWSRNGLHRLEGSRWRTYSDRDFGAQIGNLLDHFAIDGEDVWAAAPEGVLRWDGRHWRRYREAVASRDARSIIAAGGHVWVIDCWGNLSQFDGSRWTIRKIDLPGLKWHTEGENEHWPRLGRTADGALWLVWGGIWRFDGTRGRRVGPNGRSLREPWLAGSTGDRLWLREGDTLWSVSADGSTWTRYPMGTPVNGVVSANGRIWLATGDGIFQSHGAGWQEADRTGIGRRVVRSIDAGPDGRVWVVSTVPVAALYLRPVLDSLFFAPLAVAAICFLLGSALWLAKAHTQEREVQRICQAVELATGEIPWDLQQLQKKAGSPKTWWRRTLETLGTIAAAILCFLALRRLWPKMPEWIIPVLWLGIHFAVAFGQSLAKRKPLPWDPIGPGAPPRYEWGKTAKAFGPTLLVLTWFQIAIPLSGLCEELEMYLLNRALRRGAYDRALRIVQRFHFYSPEGPAALRLRGHVLLLAGRYPEAEHVLRRAVAGLRSDWLQATALECLGDALMEQGRRDEATRSYKGALHALPPLHIAQRGLAEMSLRIGEAALESVDSIPFGSRARWAGRANRRQQDDYWSLKAWALAQLGRSAEVAPAIEAAFKATNKKSRPDLAVTNYRAGMAMRAIGNESAAADYFRRARDLDPNGRRGSLAQAALAERSAWGAGV